MKLEKPLYVVCPLYQAKKRLKVADRRYMGKIAGFTVLEGKVLAENKESKSKLIEIIDNKKQHKFTHHKNKKRNIVMVKDTSVNNDIYKLEAVRDKLSQTFTYTDLYDCKFGM